MEEQSAKIATICGCIDHCFAFEIFCADFARLADPEDLVFGLDRSVEIVSDATRLQSFLALRKLDEFLSSKKREKTDLIASDLGIDLKSVLGDVGETFLTAAERDMVNKQAAHLPKSSPLIPKVRSSFERSSSAPRQFYLV